jgi:lipid II:glycine glycyltransferase (peptidoglycan interpeptide bridge formation enzyme)
MNMRIISDINKIDFTKWNEFISNHPEGTVFQSAEMFRLFEASRKFNPVIIALENDEKIIGALLAVIIKEFKGPLGFLSSRTVVYGGPVVDHSSGKESELTDILLKELIKKVRSHSVFIQFRNFYNREILNDIFRKNGFRYLERLNYLVDCTSEKEVKKRMSASKMRQVKKALKAGAEVIDPESIEQVRDFYDILYYLYKYKVKKPLPDWSFFENFYHLSNEGKLGVIKLVKYEEKIIGGILSPVFEDKVIYEWYVCGLDREYKEAYPSVLATWAAIQYAIDHNIQTFDFMGVGVPGRDYGVRDFKAKFGGELVNYGRYGRINNKFIYFITEIGFNILALLRRI